MCCSGCLIIGPFSLITTAVSAELGQHESLKGSSKAIATVTAIIDGFGSIGELILCCLYSTVHSVCVLCIQLYNIVYHQGKVHRGEYLTIIGVDYARTFHKL